MDFFPPTSTPPTWVISNQGIKYFMTYTEAHYAVLTVTQGELILLSNP